MKAVQHFNCKTIHISIRTERKQNIEYLSNYTDLSLKIEVGQ